jgi:hypothetical protein
MFGLEKEAERLVPSRVGLFRLRNDMSEPEISSTLSAVSLNLLEPVL